MWKRQLFVVFSGMLGPKTHEAWLVEISFAWDACLRSQHDSDVAFRVLWGLPTSPEKPLDQFVHWNIY